MPDGSTLIEMLQAAIQRLHRCAAVHDKTVFVQEKFRGQTVWEGDVEIFELKGHRKSSRCFAWLHHAGDNDARCVALLDSWPQNSPAAAVRAAIAYDIALTPGSHHWTSINVE